MSNLTIKSLEEENNKLRDDLHQLRESFQQKREDQMEVQTKTNRALVETLSDNSQLKYQLKESQKTIDYLKNSIGRREDEADAHKKLYKQLSGRNEQTSAENRTLRSKVRELANTIRGMEEDQEKVDEIERLKEELAKTRHELDIQQNVVRTQFNQMDELEAHLKKSAAETKEAEEKLKKAMENFNYERDKLISIMKQSDRELIEKNDVEKEAAELKTTVAMLKCQLDELTVETNDQGLLMVKVQMDRVRQKNQETKDYEANIELLKEKLVIKEDELLKALKQNVDFITEKKRWTDILEMSDYRIAQLEAENKALLSTNKNLKAKVDEMSAEIAIVEKMEKQKAEENKIDEEEEIFEANMVIVSNDAILTEQEERDYALAQRVRDFKMKCEEQRQMEEQRVAEQRQAETAGDVEVEVEMPDGSETQVVFEKVETFLEFSF